MWVKIPDTADPKDWYSTQLSVAEVFAVGNQEAVYDTYGSGGICVQVSKPMLIFAFMMEIQDVGNGILELEVYRYETGAAILYHTSAHKIQSGMFQVSLGAAPLYLNPGRYAIRAVSNGKIVARYRGEETSDTHKFFSIVSSFGLNMPSTFPTSPSKFFFGFHNIKTQFLRSDLYIGVFDSEIHPKDMVDQSWYFLYDGGKTTVRFKRNGIVESVPN